MPGLHLLVRRSLQTSTPREVLVSPSGVLPTGEVVRPFPPSHPTPMKPRHRAHRGRYLRDKTAAPSRTTIRSTTPRAATLGPTASARSRAGQQHPHQQATLGAGEAGAQPGDGNTGEAGHGGERKAEVAGGGSACGSADSGASDDEETEVAAQILHRGDHPQGSPSKAEGGVLTDYPLPAAVEAELVLLSAQRRVAVAAQRDHLRHEAAAAAQKRSQEWAQEQVQWRKEMVELTRRRRMRHGDANARPGPGVDLQHPSSGAMTSPRCAASSVARASPDSTRVRSRASRVVSVRSQLASGESSRRPSLTGSESSYRTSKHRARRVSVVTTGVVSVRGPPDSATAGSSGALDFGSRGGPASIGGRTEGTAHTLATHHTHDTTSDALSLLQHGMRRGADAVASAVAAAKHVVHPAHVTGFPASLAPAFFPVEAWGSSTVRRCVKLSV